MLPAQALRAETNSGPVAAAEEVTLNQTADGYVGIWYAINMPAGGEYPYKYSGGLGTYCDYHSPFAVYSAEANKTFFCYGGATADNPTRLLHMVSYFDHETGQVPRPTLLLDKHTNDAHDNPVLAVDKDGYIWVFSTSHGVGRPSYIHKSKRPFDIKEFQLMRPTRETRNGPKAINNFSYLQLYYDAELGFQSIFTKYGYPADRTACYMRSPDGVHWSPWQRLAQIERGHYQVGCAGHGKVATMLNMHPQGKGLDWRTNLYYLESCDQGATWQTAGGVGLEVPLKEADNPALVRDYRAEGLLVYIRDLQFDANGDPVLLYTLSKGHAPGPKNDPRELWLAHWSNAGWRFQMINSTDHNYDSASLFVEDQTTWRVITPSVSGPQPYATGGEMTLWISHDAGNSWQLEKQLTAGSLNNHTFARRPVNGHPDFYSIWADGNAERPSLSRIHFCNSDGDVFVLPEKMRGDFARPQQVSQPVLSDSTTSRVKTR